MRQTNVEQAAKVLVSARFAHEQAWQELEAAQKRVYLLLYLPEPKSEILAEADAAVKAAQERVKRTDDEWTAAREAFLNACDVR